MIRPLTVLAFLIMLLVGGEAVAQFEDAQVGVGFSCNNGTPVGELFQSNAATAPTGFVSFFLNIVTRIEQILSTLFGTFYCAMQEYTRVPLAIILTIYVMITGVLFLTGMIQMTMAEGLKRFLKMTLIWFIVTDASLGIGILYTGFMSFAQGLVQIVFGGGVTGVTVTGTDSTASLGTMGGAFDAIWRANTMGGSATPLTFSALLGALALIPGGQVILGLFIGFFITAMLLLARAVLGYLLALTGLTFLLTLTPVFLSFALFKVTEKYFETWLKYLFSYAIQMFIIFAFIALSQVYLTGVNTMMNGIFDRIAPWNISFCFGPFCPVLPLWTLDLDGDGVGDGYGTLLANMGAVMTFLVNSLIIPIIGFLIANYVSDAFLKNVPEVAKQLSGVTTGARLGGFTPAGVSTDRQVIGLTGSSAFNAARAAGSAGYAQGGNIVQRTAATAGDSWRAFSRTLGDELVEEVGNLGAPASARAVRKSPSAIPNRNNPGQTTFDKTSDKWFYLLHR